MMAAVYHYLQDERLMVAEWNASEKSFTTATPVLYTGTVELNILSVWLDSNEKTYVAGF